MLITTPKLMPEMLEGDCIPMTCDNGESWCVEYDYIKAHPEKEWKTWFQLITPATINAIIEDVK